MFKTIIIVILLILVAFFAHTTAVMVDALDAELDQQELAAKWSANDAKLCTLESVVCAGEK